MGRGGGSSLRNEKRSRGAQDEVAGIVTQTSNKEFTTTGLL